MSLNVLNPHLSRKGGGIYTVISELYNTKVFQKSEYSDMSFWGCYDQFSQVDSLKLPGIKHLYTIKHRSINKFNYSRAFRNDFKDIIHSTDLIHLHSLWQYPSIFIDNFQKKKTFKKIISTHGMLDKWALDNNKFYKKLALELFERANLNSASCIHALCEQEYIDIRKIAPDVPIAIIPNGINLINLQFHTRTHAPQKTLLFLGRIHPKKGLENLIRAWKIANYNWLLVIAGPDENNHMVQLSQLIVDLNLEETVKLVGPKFENDKAILLSNADAFILPSFSEGLPMSILEAWSYSLPVLMTPQCNLPDGFEMKSAIKIQPEIDSIVHGLNYLFSMDEVDLNNMGLNGYNLVSERYTWESVAKKMTELYDWVLGKTDEPPFIRLD